jgi:hypothetical protein
MWTQASREAGASNIAPDASRFFDDVDAAREETVRAGPCATRSVAMLPRVFKARTILLVSSDFKIVRGRAYDCTKSSGLSCSGALRDT